MLNVVVTRTRSAGPFATGSRAPRSPEASESAADSSRWMGRPRPRATNQPAVATTALLLYLAAALRVGADWLGIYFLDGLTAAAGLALLGLLLWAVFLLLKLRRP